MRHFWIPPRRFVLIVIGFLEIPVGAGAHPVPGFASTSVSVGSGWEWSASFQSHERNDSPFNAIEVDGKLLVTGYGTRTWDGATWTILPEAPSDVLGLTFHKERLYAHTQSWPGEKPGIRNYMEPGRLLQWNGGNWTDLGSLPAPTNAFLVSFRDHLVTCGTLNDQLCLWMRDEEAWKPLANAPVLQIDRRRAPAAVWRDQLFAAGSWKDLEAAVVYKFDGEVWTAAEENLTGRVGSFAVVGGDLYAAGVYYPEAPELGGFVSCYRGGRWIPIGPDWYGEVLQLIEHDGRLVALGMDERADGTVRETIRVWEGVRWTAFGGLLAETERPSIDEAEVRSIATYRADLITVGDFGSVDGRVCRGVARWNGSAWRGLGESRSVEGTVHAILSTDGRVFVAGEFSIVGDLFSPGIVEWDGKEWQTLGDGVGGVINKLGQYDGSLIATGSFPTTVSSTGTITDWDEMVVVWDGAKWRSLGFEKNQIRSLATHDAALLIGRAGAGPDGERVMRWDGRTWSVFPELVIPGLHGYEVAQLAVHEGDLFAAGWFGVCRWNGSRWERLGSFGALGSIAGALASIGGELFLGGRFESIDGVEASNVARWDGSRWHPLGRGVASDRRHPTVSAFVELPAAHDASSNRAEGNFESPLTTGPVVLVGGKFERVGDTPAPSLAVWDGEKLVPFLPGIDEGEVHALATQGDTILVGGYFYAKEPSIKNFGMLVREHDRSAAEAPPSPEPQFDGSNETTPRAVRVMPGFVERAEPSDREQTSPPAPWSFARLSADERIVLELETGGCFEREQYDFVIAGGDSLRIESWKLRPVDPEIPDQMPAREPIGDVVLPLSAGIRLDRMIAHVEDPTNIVSTSWWSLRWNYYRRGSLVATLQQSDHGGSPFYTRVGAIPPWGLLSLVSDER